MPLSEKVLTTLQETVVESVEEKASEFANDVKKDVVMDLKQELKAELYQKVKAKMEKRLPPQGERKAHNLFLSPTMIGVIYALWISVQPNIAAGIDAKKFTASDMFDMFSKIFAAAATLALRGSEGTKGVYTSKFLPGLSKEECDLNHNGIPDSEE